MMFYKNIKYYVLLLLASFSLTAFSQDHQWSTQVGTTGFETANDIFVDSVGNIFTTGYFDDTLTIGPSTLYPKGSKDIFLAKFNNSGTPEWAVSIGGISWDEGRSVVTDKNGNIYVTGKFYGTIYFGSDSIIGFGLNDIFLAKFNPTGIIKWVKIAGGPDNDIAYGVDVDQLDNIYITGNYTYSADFGNYYLTATKGDLRDIFTAKYDSSGTVIWVQQLGQSSIDNSFDIAVDPLGNHYITGYFRDSAFYGNIKIYAAGSYNFFIARFDSTGTVLWVKYAPTTTSSQGMRLDIDSQSDVYISIALIGTATFDIGTITAKGQDLVLTKYDKNGNQKWYQKGTNPFTDQTDYPQGIGVSSIGDVYVTGYFSDTMLFTSKNNLNDTIKVLNPLVDVNAYLAKYDSSGNLYWAKTLEGNQNVYGMDLHTDIYGNGYLTAKFKDTVYFDTTAYFLKSKGNDDFFIAKFGNAVKPIPAKVFIPDTNFRNFLLTNYPLLMIGDSLLTDSATKLTGMLDASFLFIRDLTGIEYFINIDSINVNFNLISYLPEMSGLSKLKYLDISYNTLLELNVSNNNQLTYINAYNNLLMTSPLLPVSSFIEILELRLNFLSSIPDLSSHTKIKKFTCDYNELDFSDAREILIADKLPLISNYTNAPQEKFGISETLTVKQGSSAYFKVASQDSATTYQWFKNGKKLAGKINSVITFKYTQVSDSGEYHCVTYGSALSNLSKGVSIDSFISKSKFLNVNPVPGLKTYIPDTNFLNYLINIVPNFIVGDSLLIDSAVTYTGNISCASLGINNLEGVQYFSGIKVLFCKLNNLIQLPDISGMTSLQQFTCSQNQLTSLPDLNGLSALTYFNAGGNNLTSMPDLSGSPNLNSITLTSNNINSFPDFSSNNLLEEIAIGYNNITSMPPLPFLPNLKYLYLENNKLKTLPNLDSNKFLNALSCSYNFIDSLPSLSKLINLKYMYCDGNKLTKLPDLSQNINLSYLLCDNNQINIAPNVSTISNLQWLDLSSNKLVSLPDFSSQNNFFTDFDCTNNFLDFSDAREILIGDSLPSLWSYYILPQYPFGNNDTLKADFGDTVSVYINSQDSAVSYQWYNNNQKIPGATDTLLTIYSLTASDTGKYQCVSYGTALQNLTKTTPIDSFISAVKWVKYSPPCPPDSVWPGDANASKNVNHYDLLSIGLFYNFTGPARDSTDVTWEPKCSKDWGIKMSEGKDIKHIDCNGDSTINLFDINAVKKNFGKSFSKVSSNNYKSSNPDLYFDILEDDVAPGSSVEVSIMIGRDTIQLYGIGFEIKLDVNIIEPNSISLSWDSSWVGKENIDLLTIDTILNASGDIFAACVRNNQRDTISYGEVARLKFKIKSDTVFNDTIKLNISGTTSGGIISNGDTVPVNNGEDTVFVAPNSIKEYENLNSYFSIFPNPAKDEIHITSLINNKINQLTFVNLIGEKIIEIRDIHSTKINIATSQLATGLYFINIRSDMGIYQEKIIIED